jgi:hypothetical protein
MKRERRKGLPPVPAELEKLLNVGQLAALRELRNFGWTVQVVRRPLFTTPVPVLKSPDGSKTAVIEEDGTVNYSPDIVIR